MAAHRREMLERFHGHLHDTWCRLALSVPGGWVADARGLVCIATGSSSPSFNLAIASGDPVDPPAALDAASAHYRSAGLRWLLKLQPELDRAVVAQAQRRGIDFDEEPVYALSPRGWEAAATQPPAGLSVSVAGRDTIEDAVRCFAEAFDAERDDVRPVLGPNLLAVPSFTVYIGYLAGEPVATSMLATTQAVQVAGVYSVATRPANRGRGFGTELTAVAVRAAQAQGYDTVMLEPSPIGAAMYRRMGFEPFTTYFEAVT